MGIDLLHSKSEKANCLIDPEGKCAMQLADQTRARVSYKGR